MPTHEVTNQVPPLVNYNLFETDKVLKEALKREGGEWALKEVSDFGKKVGSEGVFDWGFKANENPPKLLTHDRYGNRLDKVEFHPAWHQLMALAKKNGLSGGPWKEPKKGAHVVRAAKYMMLVEVEAGHACPITMTYATLPALRDQPDICKEWEPKIVSTIYDPDSKPANQKEGVVFGMFLTEKQGGSDVKANTTRAVPVNGGGPGKEYLITGHKWFCSAPMSDAFLALAKTSKGLSCFLLPRWKPDGTKNNFFIQRLKDKLGNRSNASAEIEFENAWGQLIGEEGRGVNTIIKMVNYTRLDTVLGSSGLMRQATSQAIHHSTYRSAFGKELIKQPLMKNVLADLCLESEAATVLSIRLARSYDECTLDESQEIFKRIATAISKYWICKITPFHIFESLECLGGNGYVEESIMPRLYREAPVNSIWEGSGNVAALDVLRAIGKEKESLDILLTEIKKGVGQNKNLDNFVIQLQKNLSTIEELEIQARFLVEQMTLALQASLLVQHSPDYVSNAFCASRLGGDWGRVYGTLSPSVGFDSIIERARPI